MLFNEILGQQHIKKHLTHSADNGRIPHAQLFIGPDGCGTLPVAIAYAQYIICSNTNGENNTTDQACNSRFNNFSHPDLHFAYPVNNTGDIKSQHPVSSLFNKEWIGFLKEQPYGNLFDWYRLIGLDNKQGNISVYEAQEIYKKLSLKSFEGGYKVMIIWMAERMNPECSNKLLKLIEEPPEKTVFILISENEEQIIQTIKSRCQILHFPPLSEKAIADGLTGRGVDQKHAHKIAHQANGSYNRALDYINRDSEDFVFEKWFVIWVRSAFKAKGNKAAIHDLISWSEEVAKANRETQKKFLNYCLDVFRQALIMNYGAGELVFMDFETEGFKLEKFAPFVHGNNILDISKEIQDASYHIERNANAKIVLTDLSIKLTRLLHKKSA
ncbi:DNA polymerase III subunit [Abyssalbus ytuae]|uniref:DNA polymerase III subunit delta n=1 Tax=Abyssalbus ytuae TaxID=2926907 RepID=A0A9E6ZNV4_9FLAO|nr:DNA polymerase III subunit delta' [Abyssalbus ytuae]UOB19394.1 DNA polymerase III subunit delta' [Abyssalbus ytuae]